MDICLYHRILLIIKTIQNPMMMDIFIVNYSKEKKVRLRTNNYGVKSMSQHKTRQKD